MQAMRYQRYGGPEVLELETVAAPRPGPREVQVQIHAAALNAADAYLLRGEPLLLRLSSGVRSPKRTILGGDIAGTITAVGNQVTRFQPGDAVYGDLSRCGLGGFAEYVCVPEDVLVLKPNRLSFAQSAAVPMAAVTALQSLRLGGEIAGQTMLIHGASGGVGTFALQLAKLGGATVTAVCSTRNVAQAQALGADHVVDYTQVDFAQQGRRYDLILVVNGNRTLTTYRQALRPGGQLIVVGGAIRQIMQATLFGPMLSLTWGMRLRNVLAQPNRQDLAELSALLEAGTITPVLDRCFALHELPEALRYHADGRACGKIVIAVRNTDAPSG